MPIANSSHQFRRQLDALHRLRELQLPTSAVLDIGANVGGWAAIAQKKIWPNSSFFMVEANPALRERLKSRQLPFAIALLGDLRRNATYWEELGEGRKATGNSVMPMGFEQFAGRGPCHGRLASTFGANGAHLRGSTGLRL